MYHSVPLKVVLDPRYREFMRSFGPASQHILDCHEANDEVIARFKSQQLTSKHQLVCPALIPLSDVALKSYEKDANLQLKGWLGDDVPFHHAKVGLVYNLFPLKE